MNSKLFAYVYRCSWSLQWHWLLSRWRLWYGEAAMTAQPDTVIDCTPLEKYCKGCKKTKKANAFPSRLYRRKGGLWVRALLCRCYDCDAAYHRDYYRRTHPCRHKRWAGIPEYPSWYVQ